MRQIIRQQITFVRICIKQTGRAFRRTTSCWPVRAVKGTARRAARRAAIHGTITTRDRWAVIEGDRMRMLAVPEARDAMSFPPSYVLPNVHRDAMHLLGNAVCPVVAADFLNELRLAA